MSKPFYFIKFRADNYTKLQRTPWAGERISSIIKKNLDTTLPNRIGESWEFSTLSESPSFCVGEFEGTLNDFLLQDRNRHLWLSKNHQKAWGCNTPLLVKLIDAASDLSLQLHPPIEAAHLQPQESGKWESWLILDHDEGAGIYLGLKPDVTSEQFIREIQRGESVRELLHFIPVHRGDLFTIPPCTMHALGAGICALEPQFMQTGKRAISLRLHDWNRRYDENGLLSPDGMPRQLHLFEALIYFDFEAPRAEKLEEICREHPIVAMENDSLQVLRYSQTPWIDAQVIKGTGLYQAPPPGELLFVTAISGSAKLTINDCEYSLQSGESGAIAASIQTLKIDCSDAYIYMAHCLPAFHTGKKNIRK